MQALSGRESLPCESSDCLEDKEHGVLISGPHMHNDSLFKGVFGWRALDKLLYLMCHPLLRRHFRIWEKLLAHRYFIAAENGNDLKTVNQEAAGQGKGSERKGDARQVLSVPRRKQSMFQSGGKPRTKGIYQSAESACGETGLCGFAFFLVLFCCIFQIYLTSINVMVCVCVGGNTKRESGKEGGKEGGRKVGGGGGEGKRGERVQPSFCAPKTASGCKGEPSEPKFW